MAFYEEMAEMYVGDDVSPDFYGWVFPKYDHVGVGTGTVVNRPAIKQYQKAIRERAGDKIAGGKIIMLKLTLSQKTTDLVVYKDVLLLLEMLLDTSQNAQEKVSISPPRVEEWQQKKL